MFTSRIFFVLLFAMNMMTVSFLWLGLTEARQHKATTSSAVTVNWGLGSETAVTAQ